MFLFNLAASVYITRLVDKNRFEDASKFNLSAAKILALVGVLVVA